MSKLILNKQNHIGSLQLSLFFFAVGLFFSCHVGFAEAFHLLDQHSMNFDSNSQKMIGEKDFKEITQFFHDAETAIETKNLEALMDLYSDNYINGPHKKDSVKKIWETLFSQFDSMYTMHNMRFVTTSTDNGAMIINCSGLLMGIPKGEQEFIALDNWVNNDHVFAKENGKWRLIGTSGKEQKRFWFDKPLHPLF